MSSAMYDRSGTGWTASQDASKTADAVFLRHGETALTPQRRFSGIGSGNPGLSRVGVEQARQAAGSPLLRRSEFTEVVCSPLKRCVETAEAVAAHLGLGLRVEENLREADFGMWEGMTYAEVEERYPRDLAAWKRSPDVAPTGSTETFTDVLGRAETIADAIRSKYSGASIIAVTHVSPVKALVAQALGAPPMALFAMELHPAAFSRISYSGSGASLRLFNDTSHLG